MIDLGHVPGGVNVLLICFEIFIDQNAQIASDVSLEYDVLISPRVIGLEQWENQKGFSLNRNIENEAITLKIEGDRLSLAA